MKNSKKYLDAFSADNILLVICEILAIYISILIWQKCQSILTGIGMYIFLSIKKAVLCLKHIGKNKITLENLAENKDLCNKRLQATAWLDALLDMIILIGVKFYI